MGEAVADRPLGGFHDVGRRGKVRLSDLQVDDIAPLGLQPSGLGQHLEGGLGAERIHALGETQAHPRTPNGPSSPE